MHYLNALIRLFSSSCPIVVKYCSFSLGAMNEARRCRFYICYCISDAIYFTECLFTLSANSYRFYLHYVKIARVSAIYILLIANSGNYLHLSIVVHYKTVCNNVLNVNYSFNSNY